MRKLASVIIANCEVGYKRALKKAFLCSEKIISISANNFILNENFVGDVLFAPSVKSSALFYILAAFYIKENNPSVTHLAFISSNNFEDEITFPSITNELLNNLGEEQVGCIGICPSYPSEKMDYLVIKDKLNNDGLYVSNKFISKPTSGAAITLMNQACWNAGMYIISIDYLISLFKIYAHNYFEYAKKLFAVQLKMLDKVTFSELEADLKPSSFEELLLGNLENFLVHFTRRLKTDQDELLSLAVGKDLNKAEIYLEFSTQ